jgi:hypothetical protein
MKQLLLTAALVIAAGGASASPLTDSLIAAWQAQGYERIEIETGPTQVKVEAIRGTEKAEVIYDAATGAILRQEFERVDAGENTTPGVFIDTDDDDFTDDDRGDDDGDGHHGMGDDDDDHDDDHGGHGDDDDHDDDDDHGGHGGDDDDDDEDDDHGRHGGDDD